MNFDNFGIRARITIGLSMILLLAMLSAVNALHQNICVKYESGEIPSSWIPAIENLGNMKGLASDPYLAVIDQMTGRNSSDATA